MLGSIERVVYAYLIGKDIVEDPPTEIASRISTDLHRLCLLNLPSFWLLCLLGWLPRLRFLNLSLGERLLAVEMGNVLGDVDLMVEDYRWSWGSGLSQVSSLEESRTHSAASYNLTVT